MPSFFSDNFMPHGMCFLWKPEILWLNVISDALIALAYFSIPVAIFYFVRRRSDIKFSGIFILFGLFIFCCGVTHLFSIYNVWNGSYGLHGITKAVTALVSLLTALVTIKYIPEALSIPTPAQLKDAEKHAFEAKMEQARIEMERKNEAIFKFSLELLPTGLLVIDAEQKIRIANKALERMFGYEEDELQGKSLETLLASNLYAHHKMLVEQYLENPTQGHSMASGRVVRGKTKQGGEISIEISLSAHEFEGETHAFASVVDITSVISEKSLALEVNNRIKRAVQASNDGIWEWNIISNDVWYSPQLMRMIGHNENIKPEFHLWQEHIHPEDRERVMAELNTHIAHKNRFDVVYRGMSESGDYEWMHTRGNTLFDHEGRALLMSGTLSNINELKKLESELSSKTHFLNAVLDKSLCGTYIFDLQLQENTYINEQYSIITGYTPEELKRIQEEQGLLALFHPEDKQRILDHYGEVINSSNKRGVTIEYRFRHKAGRWLWCYSLDSVYSFDENGKVKEMIGTFFEITDLKEREERIKKLALDFLMTFEQAAVGIVHINMDGFIVKANKKLCDILAYSQGSLIEKEFGDICEEGDLKNYFELEIKNKAKKSEQFIKECRFIKNGGEMLWVNLTLSLVRNDDGKNLHFVAVVEDISERKKVEKALEESNASLERFAYSASHDLQEPLRKICAFSDSLEYRLIDRLDDPDARYELSRISDAAKRMREMINSLLQLARYSSQKINKDAIKVSDVIALVKEDLSRLIHESKAEVVLEQDAELYADDTGMQQVFMNLIANGIRYAKPNEKPEITIRIEQGSKEVVILVEDKGQGFNEQFAQQIFEPFKRLVGRTIPGTGMGLALCRQIISAHGGVINARGTVGVGATFEIRLPRGEQQ
ncbi:Phytochrome-like protein cph1 [Thalassocella blandensis]|nr:Phytochrome-like protein cph1 [Thalassocella blandensis]